ncbi:MAG: SMP-30/gluconolactonase/LRE family protein [Aliishimia sp.]
MNTAVFDNRVCMLGEGPLWHPMRNQLFWFDILNHRMLSRDGDDALTWQFSEAVSAAGWLDQNRLLIASETKLFTFDLTDGRQEAVHPLEAENPITRSNDGRADPWGGFWIGTMGHHTEANAGAIYRFHQGELRTIADEITVSNAICFAPDRSCAYYTNTPTHQIMRVALHPDTGWPEEDAQVHLDFSKDGYFPDGAVTDAAGNLWVAQWGMSRVACYNTQGTLLRVVDAGATQTSCPAFGGADLRDLYITSAAVNVRDDVRASHPATGQTFIAKGMGQGVAEPRVIL